MPEEPKKHHHIKLSWWLVVLALVVFGAVFYVIDVAKKTSKSGATVVPYKPDTANEIKIKQALSSMRGDINRYFETNKTYVGWKPVASIQALGSDIKTNLTVSTYMIYATMPTSKQVFCMDNAGATGFTGMVKKVGKETCLK